MFNSQFPILIRKKGDLVPFHSDENWELRIEHCSDPKRQSTSALLLFQGFDASE